MKRIDLNAYDVPEIVARCVEVPDVGAPAPGEVVFDVLAFPINPADIGFCRGSYRLRPPLPATPGAECVGRVTAVGDGVTHVAPGDLVINLKRENWTQKRRVKAEDAIPVPSGLDLRQAAMLRINPPTALLLLTDIVDLKPGDWIVQNAANSAVGRLVVTFARERGIRTVNVTRRDDVFDELKALGADLCLTDGTDLPERVKEATDCADIPFAIDAVSGSATARMAACVHDEATVCTYGAMSGAGPELPVGDLIYRGVNFTGFMLGRFLERRSTDDIRAIYTDLAAKMENGLIHAPVDSVYPIEEIRDALIRAQTGGRHGKVLVSPNGAV
ncbi:NADPH:quinone reductase-like Zn-dependent oxidoreductase [Parvibaculum indicum]|uniref:zinc-dependent alcohol dehydrogenase family protein n=1 Tax=Parvibaculum indicum TaxID=562969 RepID=UPI00141D9CE0|nr:zinc-dependent alcohol dehydrogenase family protein [Parvibaculum indicum]NIJ43033.1 NADPH:quinone reductase-like Zn-dependent oxidoreductase [Parvibaculum indicum]